VTLLTVSERIILERIRDTGTADDISNAWAIKKGWAVGSPSSVKLTPEGMRLLESSQQDRLPTKQGR
jgi:hypothetical protein